MANDKTQVAVEKKDIRKPGDQHAGYQEISASGKP
jgi:hypothetical protein